jgi:hypothetical protein
MEKIARGFTAAHEIEQFIADERVHTAETTAGGHNLDCFENEYLSSLNYIEERAKEIMTQLLDYLADRS